MADQGAAGEAESHEILQTRIRAWWLSVLAGQATDAHPVQGPRLKARMDGNTLVLSGAIPSAADKQEIQEEVEHLRGQGVRQVRNELKVVPDDTDRPGLLVQTLLATFATAEQAGFAEGYLEGHAHIRPGLMRVIAPGDTDRDAVRAVLPEPYWKDADRALTAGRSLLIATVDETEAFQARELLDEETKSLKTMALPPKTPAVLTATQQALQQTATMGRSEQAEAARQRALQQEGKTDGA